MVSLHLVCWLAEPQKICFVFGPHFLLFYNGCLVTSPGTAAIGCRWPRTLGRQWIHWSPTILRPVPQGTRAFFVQNARRVPTIRWDSQVDSCCGSMDFQMGTVEAWRSLQSHCTVQHLAVAVSGDFWSLFLFHSPNSVVTLGVLTVIVKSPGV